MTRFGLTPVDLDEVATIVIGGWLLGCLVFTISVGIWALIQTDFEPSILLFVPMAFFMILFGAGIMSAVWVLPTGLLLVPVLRSLSVSRWVGAAVLSAVGAIYAAGLSTMPDDWQWWRDFWFAAPIYGGSMGFIFTRVCND